MKTTCGIIIIQNKKILMCHSTGNSHWDLPKGLKDENETDIQTAIRELKEETSFIVTENELEFLGTQKFNKEKFISLFKYIGSKVFNEKEAVCNSFFINFKGKEMPEADAFEFFTKDEALNKSAKNMNKILQDLNF